MVTLLPVLGALWGMATQATAETAFYTYDGLGRLTKTCTVNGPADGLIKQTEFDPADNRKSYSSDFRGFRLLAGAEIRSSDNRFIFVMQVDGNLVLYGPHGPLWATYTYGAGNFVVFQGDGNLVVYNSANVPLWHSATNGALCSRLWVQNDGNVVIYNNGGSPIWATNTWGSY